MIAASFLLLLSPVQTPSPMPAAPVVQAPVYQAAPPPPPPPPAPAPVVTIPPVTAATPTALPPPATPPYTVLLAPCAAPGDANGLGPRLRDVVAQQLMPTGAVLLVSEPFSNPGYLAAATRVDSIALASAGAMANAEKVVCVSVQTSAAPVLSLQWVDSVTAQVGWSRVVTTDGSEPAAALAAQALAAELAQYVRQVHATRPMPPPPAPVVAAKPAAPVSTETPASKPFLNVWRGAGIALMATGAAAFPAALAVLTLSGVGHLAGSELVFTLPGEKAPRFHSTVFTWTWGDLLAAGLVALGGTALVATGAVLFVLPWLLDR